MNKKILKNIILVISAALLLLAATLAWFGLDAGASVETISATINSNIETDYYEHNGEEWVGIENAAQDGILIPGKEYRYKAVISAESQAVNSYSLSLSGISVEGSTSYDDLRDYIYVTAHVAKGEHADLPVNPEDYITTHDEETIGENVESFVIASGVSESGTPAIAKDGKVTVFYSIMLKGTDNEPHNEFSNAVFKIGKVSVIAN